jgi:hypothetical protein
LFDLSNILGNLFGSWGRLYWHIASATFFGLKPEFFWASYQVIWGKGTLFWFMHYDFWGVRLSLRYQMTFLTLLLEVHRA